MILVLFLAASGLPAAERVSLTGKVVDVTGKPIGHATVLVYHAGVKTGYSTFCPSCYADCGKRAVTALDGTFLIKAVDPDLWFELLAVADGFQRSFLKKVDPLQQSSPTLVLLCRTTAASAKSVVCGRVVDGHGVPLRDSVVTPEGISVTEFPDGTPSKQPLSIYGEIKGLERVAVTDEKGDFEIASEKPALGVLLTIEARGFAPKVQSLLTGTYRKAVTMSRGALVRGRLVERGTPVAGAEIGLIPRDRGGFGNNLAIFGDPYKEIRVGTQADGSFVLADVPTPVNWYVYAKMESISKRGATEPVECATKRAGEVVNVGDIQLGHGYRLSGKIVLSDRKRIPDGMRVIISADQAWDSQTVLINSDGNFEFFGLPPGTYEISPGVSGYRPAHPNGSLSIDHNIGDFTLVLDPHF